jgi:hypothetical protein
VLTDPSITLQAEALVSRPPSPYFAKRYEGQAAGGYSGKDLFLRIFLPVVSSRSSGKGITFSMP